jgi:hypothetical protein
MCGAVLTDPFLANQTRCLMAVLDELQSTTVQCWPRISHYLADVVEFVSLCWENLGGSESCRKPPADEAVAELAHRLRELARIASKLAGDKDPRVGQILGPILEAAQ